MRTHNPEATKAVMLQAAAAELRERGYTGAALSRIAARLNLTKGALAYHFPTKMLLLEAVVARAHELISECYTIAKQAFPDQGSRACLAHMTTFGYALNTDPVAGAALSLFADPSSPEALTGPVMREWHRILTECFTQAVASEGLKLHVSTAEAAEFFMSSMCGTLLTGRYFVEVAADRSRLQYSELALRALGFADADQIVADVLQAVSEGRIQIPGQAHEMHASLHSSEQTPSDDT